MARDIRSLIVEQAPPPTNKTRTGVSKEAFQNKKIPDYAAKDARNRELGLKGELLVISHEKDRLIKAGRSDLSKKIVHVSQVEGDSAGYDIRSYDPDGTHRFIEVKTTRGGAATSFFISPNEIVFSAKNKENYMLFRLYEYDDQTDSSKAYLLAGDVSTQLSLEATSYRAKLESSVPSKATPEIKS